MILFLFLSHLAVGIVWSLAVVSKDAGVKFFRFNAGLAAILLAVAFAFLPDVAQSRALLAAVAALAVSGLALLLYWGTVGRALASVRPLIFGLACTAGLVSVVGQALALTGDRAVTTQALTVVSFLSSAALLGGACTAMILGHWYLVIPSLQVSHLQSIVKVHIAAMVVRTAVVIAVVLFALATSQPGQLGPSGLGPSFRSYIFSVSGVFFWQRVLFGLVLPVVLSYLTWETAKIRSTQSATGILYVVLFTIVVGEVLAKYLLLATRVPV